MSGCTRRDCALSTQPMTQSSSFMTRADMALKRLSSTMTVMTTVLAALTRVLQRLTMRQSMSFRAGDKVFVIGNSYGAPVSSVHTVGTVEKLEIGDVHVLLKTKDLMWYKERDVIKMPLTKLEKV